jgi:hypothetical protein
MIFLKALKHFFIFIFILIIILYFVDHYSWTQFFVCSFLQQVFNAIFFDFYIFIEVFIANWQFKDTLVDNPDISKMRFNVIL